MKISLLHIDQFASNILLWVSKHLQMICRSTFNFRYTEMLTSAKFTHNKFFLTHPEAHALQSDD